MDGPPALTLGLEPPPENLMRLKPVKRDSGIVGKKTFIRILVNGLFVGAIMLWQSLYNFLGATDLEKPAAAFTLFIFFQLFNAFNCRELGAESVLRDIGKNKIMVATFAGAFIVQLIIVQVLYKPFGLAPMSAGVWIKCLAVSSLIVIVSETAKLIYRALRGGRSETIDSKKLLNKTSV